MAQPRTEALVREYKSADAYANDAKKLARDGWTVQAQTEATQRSGCLRIIMLGGIGALVFKPKPHIVVTYSRSVPA